MDELDINQHIVDIINGVGFSCYMYKYYTVHKSGGYTNNDYMSDGYIECENLFDIVESFGFEDGNQITIEDGTSIHYIKKTNLGGGKYDVENTDSLFVVLEYHGLLTILYQAKRVYTEEKYHDSYKKRDCIKYNTLYNSERIYLNINSFLKKIQNTKHTINKSHIIVDYVGMYGRPCINSDIKNKSLSNINLKPFIEPYIINGVFKPRIDFIENLLPKINKTYGSVDLNCLAKNILFDLGVHTIHMTNNEHFDVFKYFNPPQDVKVKASKKIIQKYDLVEYCKDDKIATLVKLDAEKLKIELKKQQDREEEIRKKSTFTLMQNGEVIKENIHKDDLIQYLQKLNIDMLEYNLCEQIKPIFDAFPQIDKYHLCYWGTYYKNECSGEKCELSYDMYNDNVGFIDVAVLDEIFDRYSHCIPNITESDITLKWGWKQRGQSAIVFKRHGSSVILCIEKYDVE